MGGLKNTMFILLALFIDGLQAAISASISVIAAVPGTAIGGAAGCAAGGYTVGEVGCAIGGFLFGVLGSAGNAFLAPFTIPIGIAIGLAINTTLSIVLGWAFLVPLMFFFGIRAERQLPWGLGELIPGLNNIPFWTFLTIASLWANARKKGVVSRRRVLKAAARLVVSPQNRTRITVQQQQVLQLQEAQEIQQQNEFEAQQGEGRDVRQPNPRTQLPNMSFDVRPRQADNDNRSTYAQAA